mgnify:CR=1 FL=1
MSASPKLGNVIAPNLEWVAKVTEEALEPGLPIVDPHHHLWQRTGNDYMFHDLLADTQTGHNIVATVFVDCHSMYRKDGPAELRCLGETEFANGVAAMSASGLYGNLRACAGIVSHVDLRLGAKAGAVLDAQIAAGLRHRYPALPDKLDRLDLELSIEPSSLHDPPPAS